MKSYYWFDYETFGADPQKDRPSQFAGVRTDLDFNVIGEPLVIYCKPTPDYLPHPEACLITGITPQHALKEGVCEAKFVSQIAREMSVPGTCNVGYNNIRFDDEVTRHTRYRNFFDAYEHEWKNGNSRWDLIDVLRMAHALRPDGIEWPQNEEGVTTFRLEKLTEANGLTHEAAHDALSDVHATIGMAKLLRSAQPELFNFALEHRGKHQVAKWVDPLSAKPFVHVSSKIPASKGCIALMMPICQHPTNSNGVICFDLRQDPERFASLSPELIRERLFTPNSNDIDERPALKTVHLNKSPAVGPASLLKSITKERQIAFDLDLEAMQSHIQSFRSLSGLREKVSTVFEQQFEPITDPDYMLYAGGFFSNHDRDQMAAIRSSSAESLGAQTWHFEDDRLDEMLFRYRARNYPETLDDDAQAKWESLCRDRLMDGGNKTFGFKAFYQRLGELASQPDLDTEKRFILEELQYYGESLMPYDWDES